MSMWSIASTTRRHGAGTTAIRRGGGVSAARTGACRGATTRGLTSAGAMTHTGGRRGHGGRRGAVTGAGRGQATGTPGIGIPVIGTRGTTRRMARRTTGAITVPAQAARIALHTAQALPATAVPDIPAATIARRPTPAATIVPEIWDVRPTTEARTVRPLPPETALIRMIITARRTTAVADVTTITAELAATTAAITVPTAITTGATQVAPIAVAAEAVAVVVLTEAVAAPAAVEAVNIPFSSIERFSTIFLL